MRSWKSIGKRSGNQKTELLEDLFTLLRIDSVRDDSKITPDAPVGPGPKEALEASWLSVNGTVSSRKMSAIWPDISNLAKVKN